MKKIPKTAEKNFRMTPQRAEILRVLDGNKCHPSAEDVYRRIARRFPGVSFATVYNTLQSLLSAGELAEVRIDRSRSRFDPCADGHAHLLCTACGAIFDLPRQRPPSPRGAPAGFKVSRCNVEFYGLCRACGSKRAPGAKRRKICAKKKKK
ncbi:MAG: Fur family transcriptional regulator [Elusimicrobiales bacterium]